jgi:hypothetical protein
VRVLITFEDSHRVYGQAIAEAIRAARSDAEVRLTEPAAFEVEAEGFDPHLVISSWTLSSNPGGGRVGWIELSTEPSCPSKISIGEQSWETTNPSLEKVLAVVERIEMLAASRGH